MALSQPSWPRILPRAFVIGCATLGPLGQRLPAPGTWGSLAGLLYFALLYQRAPVGAVLIGTIIAGYFAVGICGEAEVRLRRKDPGEVVLDEVAAIPSASSAGDPCSTSRRRGCCSSLDSPSSACSISGNQVRSAGCSSCPRDGAWSPTISPPRWPHARRSTSARGSGCSSVAEQKQRLSRKPGNPEG
jgi:hypothetical protein